MPAIPGHTVANALLTLATVQLHAGCIDDARASATAALVAGRGIRSPTYQRPASAALVR